MKPQEIRIGNLLRDRVSKTELRVDTVSEKGIGTYVLDRSKYPLAAGWELEPIPLTPEWLEKAGFKKGVAYGDFYMKHESGLQFTMDYNDGGTWIICTQFKGLVDIKNPEFVHQLQNLWHALTGEELEFKDK